LRRASARSGRSAISCGAAGAVLSLGAAISLSP
jgi:hypothetical protein